MEGTITLTIAGADTGPFNLYSDVDGFISAFEVGVSKAALMAGYFTVLIPAGTNTIKVMSVNKLCNNSIFLTGVDVTTTTSTTLFPPTTTTSTTIAPTTTTTTTGALFYAFDVTADWSLADTGAVTDQTSFEAFLAAGYYGSNDLTSIVISGFSKVGNRIQCNLTANGTNFFLNYLDVTQINGIGDIVGLDRFEVLGNTGLTDFDPIYSLPDSISLLFLSNNGIINFDPVQPLPSNLFELNLFGNAITNFDPSVALPNGIVNLGLGSNQIVTFDPTIALPNSLVNLGLENNLIVTFDPGLALPTSLFQLNLGGNSMVSFSPTIALPTSLTQLFLNDNQMTTSGYTSSEAWASALHTAPIGGQINFQTNVNSVTGTTLETILTASGWSVGA